MSQFSCNGQYENAREMLPASVRVLEISHRDAWYRDQAPLFVKSRAKEEDSSTETYSPVSRMLRFGILFFLKICMNVHGIY